MAEFSEWYSTFLTDLPGGGVPMHKKRAPDKKKPKAQEQARLGTPDYQAFMRDIHRLEAMERKKLHSFSELGRSPSLEKSKRQKDQLSATISTSSLPLIFSALDSTGRPSLQGCKTFLNLCLNRRTRRHAAQVLVLDGLSDTRGATLDAPDDRKRFVSKHVDHPEVVTDDLVGWQRYHFSSVSCINTYIGSDSRLCRPLTTAANPELHAFRGLLEKTIDGKAQLVKSERRTYDEDCIDVGLTLLKAKVNHLF